MTNYIGLPHVIDHAVSDLAKTLFRDLGHLPNT